MKLTPWYLIRLVKLWFMFLWADIRIGWITYKIHRVHTAKAWAMSRVTVVTKA
jgi:hypothetical protein